MLFPPFIDLKSPFFVMMFIVCPTSWLLYLSKFSIKLAIVTSFPTQTLFLIAYSILSIYATLPEEKLFENYLPSIVFIVETWNR
jgi:hypothetical protein